MEIVAGPSGVQGDGYSIAPSLSADGRVVAFDSEADNLVAGDSNGTDDVFVRDITGATTSIVSVDPNGVAGDGPSGSPRCSADGRCVAFSSYADNLIASDANGSSDVFLRDTQAHATTLISVASNGTQGDGVSDAPTVSADGRYVAFYSIADNLVADDFNATTDVFVRDTSTGTTTLASVEPNSVQGDGGSSGASLSADGRLVAFYSYADNFVVGDTNGTADVFICPVVPASTPAIIEVDNAIVANIEVLHGQTLLGVGSISGSFVVESGGAISAGDPLRIGTLTVSSLTLFGGAAVLRLSKDGGSTQNDTLLVQGTMTVINATLTITNTTSDGTPLTAGDSFQIFNESETAGSGFGTVNLPSVANGLRWDLSALNVDGVVRVVATGP